MNRRSISKFPRFLCIVWILSLCLIQVFPRKSLAYNHFSLSNKGIAAGRFFPLLSHYRNLWYADLQGQMVGNGVLIGLGSGYRQQLEQSAWILGGYLFFDVSSVIDNSHALGKLNIGAEAISPLWRIGANAYLPLGTYQLGRSNIFFNNHYFKGHQEFERWYIEEQLGFDCTVTSTALHPLRPALGVYYFHNKHSQDKSILGGSIGLEYTPSQTITFSLRNNYDVLNGHTLIVGVKFKWGMHDAMPSGFQQALWHPVDRHLVPVMQIRIDHLVHDNVYFFKGESSGNTVSTEATFENPSSVFNQAVVNQLPTDARIYLAGGFRYPLSGTLSLQPGQSLSGRSLVDFAPLRSFNNYPILLVDSPLRLNSHTSLESIVLEPNPRTNPWDDTIGILVQRATQVNISNIKIGETRKFKIGLKLENSQNINVTDSVISTSEGGGGISTENVQNLFIGGTSILGDIGINLKQSNNIKLESSKIYSAGKVSASDKVNLKLDHSKDVMLQSSTLTLNGNSDSVAAVALSPDSALTIQKSIIVVENSAENGVASFAVLVGKVKLDMLNNHVTLITHASTGHIKPFQITPLTGNTQLSLEGNVFKYKGPDDAIIESELPKSDPRTHLTVKKTNNEIYTDILPIPDPRTALEAYRAMQSLYNKTLTQAEKEDLAKNLNLNLPLQFNYGSSEKMIRTVYRKLTKRLHPDKEHRKDHKAEGVFNRLRVSYELIKEAHGWS